jgi:hypothetical protein
MCVFRLAKVGKVRTVPVHARRSKGPHILNLPFVTGAANGGCPLPCDGAAVIKSPRRRAGRTKKAGHFSGAVVQIEVHQEPGLIRHQPANSGKVVAQVGDAAEVSNKRRFSCHSTFILAISKRRSNYPTG